MWVEGMLVLQHTSCPSHIPPILQWCTSLHRHLPLLWTSQGCSQSQAQRHCSKKNQGDDVFPSGFHHFSDISVHSFIIPDWAANSWRTHNSCDILYLTACTPLQAMKYIAAQVFLRPKTRLYRFYIASRQLKHEMCSGPYSLVLFEPPVQSERCRTIQNLARIFLSCTGYRSLFISWRVCGAVKPPSSWQLKLHL